MVFFDVSSYGICGSSCGMVMVSILRTRDNGSRNNAELVMVFLVMAVMVAVTELKGGDVWEMG